jgi:hypothetical protein
MFRNGRSSSFRLSAFNVQDFPRELTWKWHRGPFIALELLQGQTLKHLISSKPIKLDELLDLGILAVGSRRRLDGFLR